MKPLKQRRDRGHFAEITFIGINSAEIKEHKKIGNLLNVTVNFIAEVITCIKDKDKNIVSGDPEKIKKIYDTWVFSRDTTSILKYSVPEFILKNENLMRIINSIKEAKVDDGGSGAFYIYLKKTKKHDK